MSAASMAMAERAVARPSDPLSCVPLTLVREAGMALAGIGQRMHPGWLAVLSDELGLDAELLQHERPVLLNELLLVTHGLHWPDVSAARSPVELLGLLPSCEVMRICTARAVFPLRHALRRSVDAALRRSTRLALGSQTFDHLMALPAAECRSLPAPLSAGLLCSAGWARLWAAVTWHDSRLMRLAMLMLPPGCATQVAAGAPAGAARECEWAQAASAIEAAEPAGLAAEHAGFLSLAIDVFPEHAWLFGSGLSSS